MRSTLFLAAALFFQTEVKAEMSLSERMQLPLYVVTSETNVSFNKEIRAALDDHWTISPVAYITEAEYETLSWVAGNCFLIYQKNQAIEEEGIAVYSEVLRIVSFSKKGKLVQSVAGTPILTSKTSNHQQDMVNSVRILQDKIRFELYQESGETEFHSYVDKIQESHGIVKLKKLYISAQDLEDGLDYASIMDIYDGEVRIVDRSYIDLLVEEKIEDAVYVLIDNLKTSEISYICTKTIMDAETGTVLYKEATTAVSPRGFSKKDFKKLAD